MAEADASGTESDLDVVRVQLEPNAALEFASGAIASSRQDDRRVPCAASRSSRPATSACGATAIRTDASSSDVTEDPFEVRGEPPVDRAATLALLADGELELVGRLTDATNATFLCQVTSGPSGMLAVYKPRRGERPLDDFPVGTLGFRERAAFLVSETSGWDIVPPTILRDGPLGSVRCRHGSRSTTPSTCSRWS